MGYGIGWVSLESTSVTVSDEVPLKGKKDVLRFIMKIDISASVK